MCPFHGWRFGTDGGCRDVPTLSEHDAADFSRIRVQPFPIRESAGFLWVNPHLGPALGEPPELPSLDFEPAGSLVVELEVEASFDLTVLSLVDPGHVAFVHDTWWFRPSKQLREKVKIFEPVMHGFTMASHATTRVRRSTSCSAACRMWRSSSACRRAAGADPCGHAPGGELHLRHAALAHRTMLTNALYWSMPALNLLKPVARPLMRQFLGQDQRVLQDAQKGLDRSRPWSCSARATCPRNGISG